MEGPVPVRSFEQDTGWLAYLDHLPPEVRPSADELPAERWWPWRGHEVRMDVHSPTQAPLGTVVLVHGAGGHGRLLTPFALPLVRAGYRVVAPDLPGYGLTRRPWTPLRLATWVDLVADLARDEASSNGVALFGMSLGGTVVLHAAMRCEAVRAVVATTLLDLQDPSTLRAVSQLPALVGPLRLLGGLVARVPIQVRHLAPLHTMSSYPAINDLLARDPLIGRRFVPIGFFRSLLFTAPPQPVATFDRVPVLVAHPGADAWTPPALSRPTFDALPGKKRWVTLQGAHHAPLEQPGRDQLSEAALAWLADALPR